MSSLDVSSKAILRRQQLEERLKVFLQQCDAAIKNITKLKQRSNSLLDQLNCDAAELRDKFLSCLKQLDEYNYLISDFNLALEGGEGPIEKCTNYSPIEEIPRYVAIATPLKPTPASPPVRPNACPVARPPARMHRLPRDENVLISFSSASSLSSTACADTEAGTDTAAEVANVTNCVPNLTLKEQASPQLASELVLPAQSVLLVDQVYPASITHVDGLTFQVITGTFEAVSILVEEMTTYYKNNHVVLTLDDLVSMSYCAVFEQETDLYYRGLFVELFQEDMSFAEVMLVDVGDTWRVPTVNIRPLVPRFCALPPCARSCYFAGLNLEHTSRELQEFLEQYEGQPCHIRIDDNSSESLGVRVLLPSGDILNDVLVQRNLALPLNYSTPERGNSPPTRGPPELVEDLTDYPDFEDFYTSARAGPSTTVADISVVPIRSKEANPSLTAGANLSVTASETERASPPSVGGLPELSEANLDITKCPEYEDPLVAVTGYHNRDEMDICKHYKGGPEKTCFKGKRCSKRHVLMHPDGWTLDKEPVLAKVAELALPAPGTFHQLHITHVNHFNRFCAHFVTNTEPSTAARADSDSMLPPRTLRELLYRMNGGPARVTYERLRTPPATGQLVAALYATDGRWYRAKVISSLLPHNMFEVLYIDYGNVAWVHEDDVRALPASCCTPPAQAVCCVLAGVVANDYSCDSWNQATNELKCMILDRTLRARLVSRGLTEVSVELFDEQGFSVADQLAARGIVHVKPYCVIDDTNVRHQVVVP